MDILLFSMAYPVTSLGPGNRLVLWLAGCERNCPGCISPEMQPKDAGKAIPTDVLYRHVMKIDIPINGITISGGEPFDQAASLAELLKAVRKARSAWNAIVYTGYRLSELRKGPAPNKELLDCIDVLIDGPYRRKIPRVHPLTGSGNQEVHCLTQQGRAMKPALDAFPAQQANLGLGVRGLDMIIGVTETDTRATLCDAFSAEPHRKQSRPHDGKATRK